MARPLFHAKLKVDTFVKQSASACFVNTVLTKSPSEAAEFIKAGGIVAFPTETVYGLGANVFDTDAVAKIFEAKQRPADNPLIAHIAAIEQIGDLTFEVTEHASKFIKAFFPGPLTVVLRKSTQVPHIATAGLETIGVRMPRHELARSFLAASGTPVAAPSANLSGRPSPTSWEAVQEDLDGLIDCILLDDDTEIGLESTVVDCTSNIPQVLRAGGISLVQLREIIPNTEFYLPMLGETAKSPGVLHRHYSPKAKVVPIAISTGGVLGSEKSAFIGLHKRAEIFALTKLCSSAEEYAHSLFEFFRKCDRSGIETIYCEINEDSGIGVALMDRVWRAAESNVM
ncbi:MAG: L-threonylcarbamoyladenylate synthase [Pyrinomonadaceae bacterium]